MIELLLLFIALLMVLGCGIFVAAEFSFITVDRLAVERAASAGDRTADGLLHGLRSLSTQLSGAQLGITITNLAIGFLAEPAIAKLLHGPLESTGVPSGTVPAIAVIVAMVLSTAGTMVIGELVPKNLAIALPMRTARSVQGFMRGFTAVTRPAIAVLNGAANAALRRMGIEPTEELASARSPQELSFLVEHSAQAGVLPADTARLLRRSLEFGERRASDVMTPRSTVHFVGPDDSLADVVRLVRATGHSRFPVLDAGTDEVVGVIATGGLLRVPAPKRAGTSVRSAMRTPLLVPASVDLDSLLGQLRDGGQQLAVVIDEYGGVDGVVTLEDLVEELVGAVDDEHDTHSTPVREVVPGTWELSGLLRPDEIRDAIGVELPEDEEYETLGGLIVDRLGRLARDGDVVRLQLYDDDAAPYEVELRVLAMDDLRVDAVRVSVHRDAHERPGGRSAGDEAPGGRSVGDEPAGDRPDTHDQPDPHDELDTHGQSHPEGGERRG
ncbi:hemolysin family protein [Flexivirga meconopsidis]|uniref:hemolysin family protein n=1 Tax=Flexivirga meconopsidis TaxID=2977121 RepID=UPI00223FEAC6|nr:hemolysin family protein [Flexivirga meconopsidis]